MSILDLISPSEAHLPPSMRRMAREIRLAGGWVALELRDPNEGPGPDPACKPVHQYVVIEGMLWRRTLPPRPLDDPYVELMPARDQWVLIEPCETSLPWRWATEYGVRSSYIGRVVRVDGKWDLHGDGKCSTIGYRMPPRDPWDSWAAITGAQCPLCDQTLVWYEAGYVPGYRVCLATYVREDGERMGRTSTIRHRWLLQGDVLVLEGGEE